MSSPKDAVPKRGRGGGSEGTRGATDPHQGPQPRTKPPRGECLTRLCGARPTASLRFVIPGGELVGAQAGDAVDSRTRVRTSLRLA
jgi:hypothetical protein